MISESESKEILEKFVENNGMLKEYNAQMTVPGTMDHKKRVLEYLEGWGFIESFNHMDWRYYSITKKGLRLIDRMELEEKTETETMHDGTIVNRHNELLEAIKKKPGISTSELLIEGEHQSTTHNRLNELIDLGQIKKVKNGVKNCYYLISPEVSTPETIEKSPNNAKIVYGSNPDMTLSTKPGPSPGQLKIIDEIVDIPTEHIQTLLNLIRQLPASWNQFEGKRDHGQGYGYIKFFIKDVDDCVEFYNKVKDTTPVKPVLNISSKPKTNSIQVKLPLAEEAE